MATSVNGKKIPCAQVQWVRRELSQ